MTILDELAARARARVAEAKQHIPFELLKKTRCGSERKHHTRSRVPL